MFALCGHPDPICSLVAAHVAGSWADQSSTGLARQTGPGVGGSRIPWHVHFPAYGKAAKNHFGTIVWLFLDVCCFASKP